MIHRPMHTTVCYACQGPCGRQSLRCKPCTVARRTAGAPELCPCGGRVPRLTCAQCGRTWHVARRNVRCRRCHRRVTPGALFCRSCYRLLANDNKSISLFINGLGEKPLRKRNQ
jgi:hypothetical protein